MLYLLPLDHLDELWDGHAVLCCVGGELGLHHADLLWSWLDAWLERWHTAWSSRHFGSAVDFVIGVVVAKRVRSAAGRFVDDISSTWS